ncbi:MAG: carboxypeptidase-like regulatory domain-containing protein [Chitinophagaceae bacterium]|nr:carboxypeptidase-like regulatory domain-containing protein [Chitinophagaceae bacterium]
MRKSYRCLAAWLMAVLFSFTANAQSITISGTVRNNTSKESVPAVSVGVKGTSKGTYTDANGEFSLKVPKLPVVLVITSSGFENQEVTVSDASKPFDVELKVSFTLDQEVVVAATRTPQRIRESPVTIETMNSKVLKNIPALPLRSNRKPPWC